MKTIEVSDELYAEMVELKEFIGGGPEGVIIGGVGLLSIFRTAMNQGLSLVVVDSSGAVVFDVMEEYRKEEAEFHAKSKARGNPLESAPNLVDSAPVV